MATEIERKFLVLDDGWMQGAMDKGSMRQGYILDKPAVRVRINGDEAKLTIKSANSGMSRSEFEYDIPFADAVTMMNTIPMKIVEKTRYILTIAGLVWEIDVFHGENDGLVIAEVELSHEDELVPTYSWLGEEVTNDERYYNAYLSGNPYSNWVKDINSADPS